MSDSIWLTNTTTAPEEIYQDFSSGAPARAAVIESGENGMQLAILTIHDGSLEYISSEGFTPVWSADGALLLYRVDNELWMYKTKSGANTQILDNLSTDISAYAISRNNQYIAAVLEKEILVFPAGKAPVNNSESHRIPIPEGAIIGDLLWAPNNRMLLVRLMLSPTFSTTRLMLVDAVTGQHMLQNFNGINKLLGWQKDSYKLVVSQAKKDSLGEEAGILSPQGVFHPFTVVNWKDGDEAILNYLPMMGQLVFTATGEDTSDPIQICLKSTDTLGSQFWLRKFTHAEDLSFSNDGKWAMFISRPPDSDSSGRNVYLVRVGSEDAKVVLKAVPGKDSYSSPIPQP